MRIIQDISRKIKKEIKRAQEYAECALNTKSEYPTVAEAYYTAAAAHMANVKLLHDQVTLLIANYRKEHGEPPQHMLMLYDILHEEQIADASAVKGMMALYKEG